MAKKKPVKIHTDGSRLDNSNGGWSALIEHPNGQRIIASGGEKNTTNNRMELTAVIEAIKNVKPKSAVTIYSDSMYVVENGNERIERWKKNNYKTKGGVIKNTDLWDSVYNMKQTHNIRFEWVPAHSENSPPENVIADLIAKEEAIRLG